MLNEPTISFNYIYSNMKVKKICKLLWVLLVANTGCTQTDNSTKDSNKDESMEELAKQFVSQPSSRYRPYVWWHWMGSNFSKEGITKDLEAMAESGIGGATIFNLASAVQESHKPIGNNPWPEQTYRSEAYWEAMRHAASEAKRLGLKIGIQNTPGYSTTGGPWITEERGMQTLVSTRVDIDGGKEVSLILEKPKPPIYKGWGSSQIQSTYYKDIAVLAIPTEHFSTDKVVNISQHMKENGSLCWEAPSGKWTIVRLGYGPTMANPHPLPDELIGKALEADKMSQEQSIFHWTKFLEPLKKNLGEYLGDSFDHVLIDSYEAGNQNWTKGFEKEFLQKKGYDPIPYLALLQAGYKSSEIDTFKVDYDEMVKYLFMENGWKVAKKMINQAGLDFYWEPYSGPFDTYTGVGIADLPMGEFWTGGTGAISEVIVKAAADYGKKIVGAEAFTGSPSISTYTEDPEFLKPTADGSFASGVNRLFLHHWVHQPFDDKYQPGMGMGWWGTHFGRNQTWFKPAKAFFTYLSRCQMLLQQGKFISTNKKILRRSTAEAEIYFVINPSDTLIDQDFAFNSPYNSIPELWDAYKGAIIEPNLWRKSGDSLYVHLKLQPHESVFVVSPKSARSSYKKVKEFSAQEELKHNISDTWQVEFYPKLQTPFYRSLTHLIDFSLCEDDSIKYFSGTALYKKNITIAENQLQDNKRIVLDFGQLYDIAELKINGKFVSVLWYPPYKVDISQFIKKGENLIELAVTNNWANRLIGDEQHPADFEWGEDRGNRGRAMKSFPDWFIKGKERPEQKRIGFLIWYYHRKDSPLQPAGLCGPVFLIEESIHISANNPKGGI